MNADDRNLIDSALSTLSFLVDYAIKKTWENICQLVRIAEPGRPLGGESAADEIIWWKETILGIAENVARKPIVQTPAGRLPAVSAGGGETVSFLVPAVSKNDDESVTFTRIYEVVSVIKDLHR